jgi:hypothetical protein
LKSAVEEEKAIPTEIIAEARGLLHELEADVLPLSADKDDIQAIDDEYANIGKRFIFDGARIFLINLIYFTLRIKGTKSLHHHFQRS